MRKEPFIRIGIMREAEIRFTFRGEYRLTGAPQVLTGHHRVQFHDGALRLNDQTASAQTLIFEPVDASVSAFELIGVTIGLGFHWERKENQLFRGKLEFIVEDGGVRAINLISLEDYLVSVISSEMKATSNIELLKSHAVISRSWLLSQIEKRNSGAKSPKKYRPAGEPDGELIRWYDREDHQTFDVCADDHCQRYQGITRQSTPLVEEAVAQTRGILLMFGDEVCDARFSKCCGGVTETFENVWEPRPHSYLRAIADVAPRNVAVSPDLSAESAAEKWIRTNPDAFCNTRDQKVLSQVLNDYDQETADFYRWTLSYTQEQISDLIFRKSGIDFGRIMNMIPLERGKSGRLIRLKIVGTKRTMVIGKELEIRKWLSESHLYSAAFVVDAVNPAEGVPEKFVLTGAGWGHGVGLCQIGAAMMAEKGYPYDLILRHYFQGAILSKEY